MVLLFITLNLTGVVILNHCWLSGREVAIYIKMKGLHIENDFFADMTEKKIFF